MDLRRARRCLLERPATMAACARKCYKRDYQSTKYLRRKTFAKPLSLMQTSLFESQRKAIDPRHAVANFNCATELLQECS